MEGVVGTAPTYSVSKTDTLLLGYTPIVLAPRDGIEPPFERS